MVISKTTIDNGKTTVESDTMTYDTKGRVLTNNASITESGTGLNHSYTVNTVINAYNTLGQVTRQTVTTVDDGKTTVETDDVEKKYGRYYYDKTSIRLKEKVKTLDPVKQIKEVMGKKVVMVKDYDGVKLELEDTTWIMVRASGTEPILRAYAESKSPKRTKELLNYALELAKTL